MCVCACVLGVRSLFVDAMFESIYRCFNKNTYKYIKCSVLITLYRYIYITYHRYTPIDYIYILHAIIHIYILMFTSFVLHKMS